jgi:uncharacterized membrane protein
MSAVEPPSTPPPPRPPAVSDTQLALAVYVLYFAGFFTMITALVGVIIAYAQVDKADDMLRTHYLSAIVIVGIFILLWWFIWTLVRCVKGLLALNENRPIQNPGSWLFG